MFTSKLCFIHPPQSLSLFLYIYTIQNSFLPWKKPILAIFDNRILFFSCFLMCFNLFFFFPFGGPFWFLTILLIHLRMCVNIGFYNLVWKKIQFVSCAKTEHVSCWCTGQFATPKIIYNWYHTWLSINELGNSSDFYFLFFCNILKLKIIKNNFITTSFSDY